MANNQLLARLMNRRIRITGDANPLFDKLYDGRYQWMKLDNLKVSPRVYERIVAQRNLPDHFDLSLDKRLAVIIPFRNRDAHLKQLVPRLRQKLADENIQFTIFVVEQCDDNLFNKGSLMNAGVTIAGEAFDYFCFHDVDMLPLDCSYGFPSTPFRLLSSAISQEGVRQISNVYFGGIVSLARAHLYAVNGFSNNFWHWGKEDDNFLLRLLLQGLTPIIDTQGTADEFEESSDRYNPTIAGKSTADKKRGENYTKRNRRYQYRVARGLIEPCDEGLNNVKFELLSTEVNEQYTRLRVKL